MRAVQVRCQPLCRLASPAEPLPSLWCLRGSYPTQPRHRTPIFATDLPPGHTYKYTHTIHTHGLRFVFLTHTHTHTYTHTQVAQLHGLLAFLGGLAPFRALDERQRAALAVFCRPREVAAGAVLAAQGEPANALWMVGAAAGVASVPPLQRASFREQVKPRAYRSALSCSGLWDGLHDMAFRLGLGVHLNKQPYLTHVVIIVAYTPTRRSLPHTLALTRSRRVRWCCWIAAAVWRRR